MLSDEYQQRAAPFRRELKTREVPPRMADGRPDGAAITEWKHKLRRDAEAAAGLPALPPKIVDHEQIIAGGLGQLRFPTGEVGGARWILHQTNKVQFRPTPQ